MIPIKRALLSCSDKTGLDELAAALAGLGVEIIASGGTADFLTQRGLRLRSVEEFAGISEQLDGRVKTLHPKIHGGILARRDDPSHVRAVGAGGLIDLVVVNLYPFERIIQRADVSLEEAIEQIDVGGVALLRAAAKNFAHVAAICHPDQYLEVGQALSCGKGMLPIELTRRFAARAFVLTSAYDAAIAAYLSQAPVPKATVTSGTGTGRSAWPERAAVSLRLRQALRYGENPHQAGAWYLPDEGAPWGLGALNQVQGKELSYNNLLDLDAALRCLMEFSEPACAIIKHHSQCGLATAAEAGTAFSQAYDCDAESAFGGIVGLNRPIDATLAERLTSIFLEVVAAPSVTPEAEGLFRKKPNLRVLTMPWPMRAEPGGEWRQLTGSWLLQNSDAQPLERERSPHVVTKRQPTAREREDLAFAWLAAKHVTSNGVVLAKAGATIGIGQGQPSRVGSVRLALEKAGARARCSVAASDGFFPFPDSLTLLAKAGVTAVIQPGGSIRDAEVVQAADWAKLAMLITGVRHFRH